MEDSALSCVIRSEYLKPRKTVQTKVFNVRECTRCNYPSDESKLVSASAHTLPMRTPVCGLGVPRAPLLQASALCSPRRTYSDSRVTDRAYLCVSVSLYMLVNSKQYSNRRRRHHTGHQRWPTASRSAPLRCGVSLPSHKSQLFKRRVLPSGFSHSVAAYLIPR